jgi:hypothetical protein
VWKNLVRHYLLCLDRAFSLFLIAGEEHHTLSSNNLPVFSGLNDFPTEDYRLLFGKISESFFAREDAMNRILGMASCGRQMGRDELKFHLDYLHLIALECIFKNYETQGIGPLRTGTPAAAEARLKEIASHDVLEKVSNLTKERGNADQVLGAMFSASVRVQAHLTLANFFRKKIDFSAKNKNFVMLDFPEKYLQATERIAFPEWYTSCFMSDCSNSSVWGNYSVNHTGVCLIFEATQVAGKDFLPLHGYVGYNGLGPTKGLLNMPFLPISYAEGYARIDFYRSIGRLPAPTLRSTWYSDDSGNVSVCAQDVFTDEDNWRRRYWDSFRRDALRKTKDWAYEKEHRLVLYGSVVDYSNPEHRTLTYNFPSLKGLIFGIKTKTEDKLKIMEVIEQKCVAEKRTDFKFYQAYYDPDARHIGHFELTNLLGSPHP